jgi:hypothetical protein
VCGWTSSTVALPMSMSSTRGQGHMRADVGVAKPEQDEDEDEEARGADGRPPHIPAHDAAVKPARPPEHHEPEAE